MNKYAALAAPQAELDLHEHSKEEAVTACRNFIQEAIRKGLQRVLIITGKGIHSADKKAVLKPLIETMLSKMEEVRSFVDARRDRGGEGALEVVLETQAAPPQKSGKKKK